MDRHATLSPTIRAWIHSGGVVFAAVPARQADHYALVSIGADVDRRRGHFEWPQSPSGHKRILIRHNSNDDPVIGYEVVHREWDRKYTDDPNYWEGGPVDYQQEYTVQSELELMDLLHTLHLNGTEFSLQNPFY